MEENRANILRHMQICRFCLNPDGTLTNIYDTKNSKKNAVPLPLQIMACAAIEAFQNDGMPQLICNDCRSLALQAYSFKTNCKKADDTLKLFLATGNFIKPFAKGDFENYLPKGAVKLNKVRGNVLSVNKIKSEPEHQSDDSQVAQESHEDEQPLEEYEIRPASRNAYSVKVITSSPKSKSVEVKPKTVKTDCFSCTSCERSFPLKQLLDIHMLNHNRDSNLHRHEKTHGDVIRFTCNYCQHAFLNKDDLVAHTKKQHSKKRPFTCLECGKSFVFKQGLERHVSIHTEDKPHKCNYCEASFTSQIKLTRHVTSHAGLRPYPCKMCKRTFLLSHHLTRHMRSHYAAKSNNVQQIGQHKCDICSMSFRRKDSLINHSAIHSMVNLKCVICYTEFNTAQAVKDHITTHLSGLPFPCEKCDYSFETKEQLEEHEVKHAEMEYEEQIEKEVVEEARAKGHLTRDLSSIGDDDDEEEEFGGDHMGRNGGDDDEEYQDDEEDESHVTQYSAGGSTTSTMVRRSGRVPKPKQFANFLKDELESDAEDDPPIQIQQEQTEHNVEMQMVDSDQEFSQGDDEHSIKPIFRLEGTKVYQRKTPAQKPKIMPSVPSARVRTAPLCQINQPQVTTIENLGLTTKDLQDLPTERYVNMKIGNKTVRVQKLVLTKEEMKTMAKEGKIRGNTVLIRNPGQINPMLPSKMDLQSVLNDCRSPESTSRSNTKTYKKKKMDSPEACNAAVVGRDSVIINDVIIDNIDDQIEVMEETTIDLS